MKRKQINTKLKGTFVRLLSLSMILVFILLGVAVKQSASSKLSAFKKYEKGKKTYSDSDFLLFEEDELADDSEDGQEWHNDFTLDSHSRSLCVNFEYTNRSLNVTSLKHRDVLNTSIPIFISIRTLRI